MPEGMGNQAPTVPKMDASRLAKVGPIFVTHNYWDALLQLEEEVGGTLSKLSK